MPVEVTYLILRVRSGTYILFPYLWAYLFQLGALVSSNFQRLLPIQVQWMCEGRDDLIPGASHSKMTARGIDAPWIVY